MGYASFAVAAFIMIMFRSGGGNNTSNNDEKGYLLLVGVFFVIWLVCFFVMSILWLNVTGSGQTDYYRM
ncbi:hypothetical protein DC20_19030 [Rufibacter tibetensis]|uniref:Uncharacterized protein n=1 Tax=Rufibacter tibetensis TaxID=512763 RepID=A0A0P0CLY0_9BACT|nr:hypothetical protein DC20_19030 [Rufibacter tibetensis]